MYTGNTEINKDNAVKRNDGKRQLGNGIIMWQ